jgi:tight adherence protein B
MPAGAAPFLLVALLALALAAAAQGSWLLLRGSFGEGRTLRRRLARIAAGAEPKSGGEASSALDSLIDARLPWLRRRLLAARAPFTPIQMLLGSLALSLAFLVLTSLSGAPLLLALAAAGWGGLAAPLLLLSWLAERRRQLFRTQLPQTVDLMARSLQAGHPVNTAMLVAAQQMPDPMGPELALVLDEMNYGLGRDAALRKLIQRFPLAELRMLAATLEVTRETGGNVAEVFLKLADTMRAKAQLRRKVLAISAEGRLTFWIVSALPFAVAGAIIAMRPGYYTEVMADPLFLPLMCGPPLLLALGAAMIWRMVNFRI